MKSIVAKFIYYCVHRLQPAIFDDYYKFVTNVSKHCLRSVNDDKLYYISTHIKKKSGQNLIKYNGVKIWNFLSKSIKTLSFAKFKKSCRLFVKNVIE